MTTARDLINKTALRLMPTQSDITVGLNGTVLANATSLPFTDTSAALNAQGAIVTGSILSVDLELYLVTGAPSGGSIPVSAGYRGSTSAGHASGSLVHINSPFPDFSILQAINDELDSLSSIENGLFNIGMCEVTYNSVFVAYDLTDVTSGLAVSNLKDIIALRYKTPAPDRKYPGIPDGDWELLPSNPNDLNFPSGYQLQINGNAGYPGQPINVIYRQGFTHLTSYTDDVQTVGKLPSTCNDIPPLGAQCILVASREVRRMDPGSQPDSRLAPESPPGAIMNSTAMVMRQRERRITEEASNLKALVSRYRRRY